MPRLPGVSQKQAERALRKVGFEIMRQGKHVTMSDGVRIIQLPRHNPINSFTMGKIVQDAGMTPDEFRKLL
jgi:predicted RNA binding protein YcfA (HicA-like mRNA interferase family)